MIRLPWHMGVAAVLFAAASCQDPTAISLSAPSRPRGPVAAAPGPITGACPETVQLATPVELQAIVVVPPPVGTRGGVAEMLAPGAYTVTGLK